MSDVGAYHFRHGELDSNGLEELVGMEKRAWLEDRVGQTIQVHIVTRKENRILTEIRSHRRPTRVLCYE